MSKVAPKKFLDGTESPEELEAIRSELQFLLGWASRSGSPCCLRPDLKSLHRDVIAFALGSLPDLPLSDSGKGEEEQVEQGDPVIIPASDQGHFGRGGGF